MSLLNTYTIYRHIASNGKSYIGVTRQENLNRRWMSGHGYASCPLFNNAIQKYGWDNFVHEILENQVPIIQINEREKYWINFYKADQREYGYNIENGGHAYRSFSEETKKKISEALINRPKTKEHKKKLSIIANKGKKFSDDWKKNISLSHQKAVIQLDKNYKIVNNYNSIQEAALTIHGDASSIAKCCKGKAKTHKGFIWKYKEAII